VAAIKEARQYLTQLLFSYKTTLTMWHAASFPPISPPLPLPPSLPLSLRSHKQTLMCFLIWFFFKINWQNPSRSKKKLKKKERNITFLHPESDMGHVLWNLQCGSIFLWYFQDGLMICAFWIVECDPIYTFFFSFLYIFFRLVLGNL
jgi:hypothetical protein